MTHAERFRAITELALSLITFLSETRKMTDYLKERLAYELALGKRCSDNHWWRTRCLLKRHNLAITSCNLQLLARLRQLLPRTAVGVDGLLEAYNQALILTEKARSQIQGSELVLLLNRHGIQAHRTTVGRWFKKAAGGYSHNRYYLPQEVQGILICAFLYKASQTNKFSPTT